MSHIILEATLHEQHNGAGQGQEVKRAKPGARVRLLSHHTALPPGCCSQMLGSTRDANRGQHGSTDLWP